MLPDGSQFCSAGASAASAKMESIGGVVASGIAFGLIGVLVASNAEDKARVARQEDYRRKELQETRLAKGQTAYGFLYFVPPPGTKGFSEADLVFRCVDTEDLSCSTVKLFVNKIGFSSVKGTE